MLLNGLTNSDILNSVLKSYSRYINLDIVEYSGKRCLNVPNPIHITESQDSPDSTVVITGRLVNRLDLVSIQYYSTPRYWWILAYYNNLDNPYILPHGTILKIPSYTTLLLNDLVKS